MQHSSNLPPDQAPALILALAGISAFLLASMWWSHRRRQETYQAFAQKRGFSFKKSDALLFKDLQQGFDEEAGDYYRVIERAYQIVRSGNGLAFRCEFAMSRRGHRHQFGYDYQATYVPCETTSSFNCIRRKGGAINGINQLTSDVDPSSFPEWQELEKVLKDHPPPCWLAVLVGKGGLLVMLARFRNNFASVADYEYLLELHRRLRQALPATRA